MTLSHPYDVKCIFCIHVSLLSKFVLVFKNDFVLHLDKGDNYIVTLVLPKLEYNHSSISSMYRAVSGLETRFKMLVVQRTTNMNILVVRHNSKLSAQKWEQKLNFDHDHNIKTMFDSKKNYSQNLVGHSHKLD